MTGPVPPEALAAARAAVPFVNSGACRRILAAGAPAIEADVRERIRQLALVKRAVYCKACDGAPCDYADELAPFAGLLREQP